MFRRFGEPIQTNSQSLPSSCMTGQSSEHSEHEAIGQYTAPSGQAMQAADCTSTSVTPQSLRQHGPSMADQVLFGPALLPSFDAQEPTDQTDKQSRFRKQLDDALKLRSWKGKQSQSSGSTDPPDQLPDGQLSLTPASQPVQKTVALSLSPGPESVLLVAASELGFDAEHDSNLRLPQPKGPVQPLSHTIVPARLAHLYCCRMPAFAACIQLCRIAVVLTGQTNRLVHTVLALTASSVNCCLCTP